MNPVLFFNLLCCAAYIVALVIVARIIRAYVELEKLFKARLANLNELTAQGVQLKKEYTDAIDQLNDERAAAALARKHWDALFAGTSRTGETELPRDQTEPVR